LTTAVRAAELQVLRGHRPAAVANLAPVGSLPASQRLNLAIGLPLRNKEALTNLLHELSDPASPNYRQFLTTEQFTERFGPSKEDYQALVAWATAQGLEVTTTHPNRAVLSVRGGVAEIQKAFHLTLRLYQHPTEARQFYSPDVEPSLDLAVPVLHISGLDDYSLPHPRLVKRPLDLTANLQPNAGSGPGGTYMGDDFRAAYVPGSSLNGSGQTVGLLQFDAFYPSDITTYENLTGRPNVPLTVVPVDGGTTPGFGNPEVSLDIEMVISMAPGISGIYVYEAPNPSPWVDLLSRMANDNLSRQLSCSWGGGPPDPAGDQIFLQMAAQGQSFFNACGDSDAFVGPIDFPAESPYIMQVGGTTLTTTGPVGAWESEKVWNWGDGVGTCGGISVTYAIPTWQQGINMTTNQGSTTMRNIPDVALTADNVYVVYGDGSSGDFGGTSCAAPLWAGFTSLINQQAASGGQSSVGFLNPALYAIGKGPNFTYTNCFHDITTGDNTWSGSPDRFFAVPGYDLCTGWGTPTGTNLINALASPIAGPFLIVVSNYLFGGNGNGIIDTNECNSLNLTLANAGTASATGVKATLSTTTPEVSIAQATSAYPDIPVNASATNLAPFKVSTSPSFICGTPIEFSLLLQCDQTVRIFQFTLPTGTAGTPLRFDNNSLVPIPSPGTINSTILVSNVTSIVNKVTVSMYVAESYDYDLQLELIAPDGTTNILSANNGFGQNFGAACSPDPQRTTFDDDATTSISTGQPPFVGSFQPTQPLAVFAGKSGTNVNGLWQLRATDADTSDLGAIECWSLFITPTLCVDGGGECPGADMALGMTAQPNPVIAGNNVTYSITVTNNGPSTATNVSVTCTFPTSFLFTSATSSQGTYAQAGGGVVIFNLGRMGPRATATMTAVMLPTVAGTLYSTATVGSEQPDPNPLNNTAIVPVLVNPAAADLAVGIAATPSSVIIGNTLTYTVSVTNNGPSTGTGVSVTNALPAGVEVLSATVSQGSITTGGGFWTVGTLANGARATATIAVVPTVVGTITATTTVTGNQFDPNPANNTATVTTVVGAAADLAIGIAEYPNPAVTGSNVTYMISVTNLGPSAATSVSVNGSFSPDLTVLSTNATQGAVSTSTGALTWSLGTLADGAKATLTIVAKTSTNETLITTATVTATETDPNPANNSASSTVVVTAPFVTLVSAGATLSYQSGPTNGAINSGETVTVILRLLNAGNVSTLNLVATLSATNGVAPVSPTSQTYGVLAPSGFPVGRAFTFTANGTNGQTIYPTLQLQDGATVYPPVSFSFTLPSTQVFANTNTILIPDPAAPDPPYPQEAGPAKPYPSAINVSNFMGVLGTVTLTLSNLNHTYPSDVNVLLVSPGGASALVMSHAGDQPVTGLNLTFDDSAPAGPLPETGQLVSGVWQPTAYSPSTQLGGFPANAPAGPYPTTLSALNGVNANGSWSLYVFDDSAGDAGAISNGWSLALTSIVPVNQIADLGLTAAAAPSPGLVGGTLTYTFTITNAGPNTATDVAFTNVLPAGVTLVSAGASQGDVLTTPTSVIVSLGTLNTGAVATVTSVIMLTTTAIPQGATNGTVTSVANVTADETDLSPVSGSVSVVTPVNRPVADLGLTQTVAPNPVVAGYSLTNTVVITNNGPGTAVSAVLTEPLPPGAGFIAASSSSTVGVITNTSGAVTCALGDLASNATATVIIVLTNSVPGLMTNAVSLSSGSYDPISTNNSATSVVTVVSPAPQIVNAGAVLTYESGPVNGVIDPGETVTLSFALANIGSLDTVNLEATLLASGGVTSPSGPQYYGALIHGGPAAARSFTFKAASVLNGATVATLQLQDERPGVTNSLGTVAFAFSAPATNSFTNSAAITIPDHGVGTPYPSTINVSGLTGRVSKATLTLNGLTHAFPHDVNVLLVSPSGSNVLVMSHTGGGYPVTNVNLTFDDAATNNLPNYAQITSGTYKPSSYQGPFQLPDTTPSLYQFALAGMTWSNPNGAWSLYVFDDKVGDSGVIASGWSLNLSTIVTVGPVVDLAVGLTAPASLYAGGSLTNTINVTNFGPDSATGVVLTNPLPANVNFISASLSQGSLTGTGGGLVTCSLGTLPAGGTATVVIVEVPTVAQALLSTVNVAANEEDLNPANNSAQAETTVSLANSSTAVSSSANPSVFGQAVTFSATVTPVLPVAITPTGTVQFKTNGVNFGSAVTLSNASASSAAISSLVAGSYTVTANYSGDSGFNTSSGTLAGGQAVNLANSSTAVSSSVNPSVFGQAVTFSATVAAVSPGAGTPTGTVQFKTNGVNFGSPVALAGGSASSAAISSLAAGSCTVTANYSGDGSFNTSSGTLSGGQTVNRASTATAVSTSINPSVFGQAAAFGATVTAVSPGAGTPTGTVQFKTNGVNFGSPVALAGGSASSASISSFAVGSYTVTANYSGDSGFNTSSGTLAGGQTVNKANSSTAVSSSVNPSVFGQAVTFGATVAAVSPGAGTPTGTVQFKTNGVNFGSPAALAGGSASSAAISSLAAGNVTVTALYNGDAGFNTSTNTLSGGQTVNRANSSTAVNSSANPSVFGQAVTFSATVTAVSPGAGTPTGTVQFQTNGVNFGGAVTLSGGSASSAAISSLAVGSYTVTANYSGDSGFNASTNTLSGGQTVNKANSSTAVSSSANPSVFGQAVTFSATVTAVSPGAGTPTGTVQFQTNGVNFGSAVALSGGSASSAAVSSLAVGSYTVTAAYSGDSGFNASTNTLSGSQTVNKANSSTAVSSSVNPSVFGQAVTFSANVTAVSPGAGTPTGTVQFKTNGVNFGSAVALSGGSASSAAISSLAVGATTVTAVYNGDANFNTGASSSLSQTVNKANSSTAVNSSVNPSVFGQAVTFSATVTAVSPGVGTPTGTVQFKTNGVNFGSAVALAGGSASSAAISSLAAGNYTVTANYSGDSGFNTSSGTLAGSQTGRNPVLASLTGSIVSGQFRVAVTAQPGFTYVVEGSTNFVSWVPLSTNTASSGGTFYYTDTTSPIPRNRFYRTLLAGGQVVNQANSAVAVSSPVNPSVFGQAVTFSATVTAVSPGAGTPTGTVQFQTNGVNFGSAVALLGGSANSAAISSLAAGSNTVTVVYNGDANFNASTNTLSGGQVVNPANSSTAVSSSANPSMFGQAVTFSAAVTAVPPGAGTPTGTVQFQTNGVNFGSAVTLSGGSASSAAISSLAVGNYTVTGNYSGDAGFNTSSGTLAGGQTVNNPVPASLSGSFFGGQFQLTVTAPSNYTYVVQGSTNLTSWVSLSTNTNPTGTFNFIDTTTPAPQQRFYRTLRR
jgi:uncharacterized repeat protein (TIGR01451 family)